MIFLLSAIRTNSLKSGFKDGIPRLCGEKDFKKIKEIRFGGSPPPMRGKDTMPDILCAAFRITPAYAGKRQLSTPHTPCTEDHPRLCGEKKHYILPFSVAIGSPPPMRGKVVRHTHTQDRFRITPAYAGKRNRLEFQPSSI